MQKHKKPAVRRSLASSPETDISDDPRDVKRATEEQRRLAKKFPDMGIMSRIDALNETSRLVGISRSRSAFAENYGKPGGVIQAKEGVDYSAEGARVNAKQAQKEAGEFLKVACGDCALAGICKIKNNLGAWVQHHPSSRNPSGEIAMTEDRVHALKRLEDPMQPCISSPIEKELAEKALQAQHPTVPRAA